MTEHGWAHVYPINDLKEHWIGRVPKTIPFYVLEGYDKEKNPIYISYVCDCKPRVDVEEELIIHNSWDCREAVEEAERILNHS